MWLLLTVAGAVVPLWQFAPWLLEHGLDLPRFFADKLVNDVAAFFAATVIVTTLAVINIVLTDDVAVSSRDRALVVAATLCIGPSCGVPLYWYLRSRVTGTDRMLGAGS